MASNHDQGDPSREWTCVHCGCTNPLFAVSCRECHEKLTDEEAQRQGIKGHETGLPPSVRREFDEKRQDDAEKLRLYEEYLRNRIVRDMIAGAVITFASQVLLGCLIGSVAYPLVALPVGAAAGYFLNRRMGGNFTGGACFGVAFVISWIISLIITGANPLAGQGFAVAFFVFGLAGLAISLTLGYLMGLTLTMERFDRGF